MLHMGDVKEQAVDRAGWGSGRMRTGQDVGVNSYAVGRRRPVSTFVEKD